MNGVNEGSKTPSQDTTPTLPCPFKGRGLGGGERRKLLRNQFRKNLNKREGFTLLEVIVGISILTVGLLAVASMQASSIRGNSFAGGVTEGATWAADRMEKLVALG